MEEVIIIQHDTHEQTKRTSQSWLHSCDPIPHRWRACQKYESIAMEIDGVVFHPGDPAT